MIVSFTFEDVANHPAIVAMTKAYPKSIRNVMIEAFYSTFRTHTIEHAGDPHAISLDALRMVTWEDSTLFFHAFFSNGDCYHYKISGEWF